MLNERLALERALLLQNPYIINEKQYLTRIFLSVFDLFVGLALKGLRSL